MALTDIAKKAIDTVRGGIGQATRAGRGAGRTGVALGKRFANRNPAPKAGMDDVTLARKVETEIFRAADSPKGKVDVNAVDGVVWLRGEVKNKRTLQAIEAQVRAIPEVVGVENLLHLPSTPPASRTRRGGRKTSTARGKAQPRRFDRTAKNAEAKTAVAEPAPAKVAATRGGRKAAPLGSEDLTTAKTSPTGGTTPAPAPGGDTGTEGRGGDTGTDGAS